ncbi:DUF6153 family protein [Microbacterium deminutum]|uniref:DUF2946 domain-containing protein n=1 Tax=Microbacterium deminutum TaxID=344164 RepID=A0ABP5CVS2_9MICO
MSMIALAQRLRRGPGGLRRSILLLIGVTAAIIVGLLAMHSLNSHSSLAEPTAVLSVHGVDATDHGTTQPATGDDCSGCGGHPSILAMTCVLALLVVSLLLVLPRRGITWTAALRRVGHSPLTWVGTFPKPPSFLLLCISRT